METKKVKKSNIVLEQLKIQYVPIKSIKPNTYNANRQTPHDFEMLQKSMREDGFTQPVIVQNKTKEIVDGEHRWRAAQKLGMKEIPVVFVDMTIEQMKIATLRHNRARGNEDIELTAEIIRDLEKLGALNWVQDSLLMSDLEIQKMIEEVEAPDYLGGEEYDKAWEQAKYESNEGTDGVIEDKKLILLETEKAKKKLKYKEDKLKKAKSDEEKQMIMKECENYRINIIFSPEESKIVKEVMKDHNVAEMILKICQKILSKEIII